jgi:hypothetical protein
MFGGQWYAGAWFAGDWSGPGVTTYIVSAGYGSDILVGTVVNPTTNTLTTQGTGTDALTGTVSNPVIPPVEPVMGGGGGWTPTYRALGRRKKQEPVKQLVISGKLNSTALLAVDRLEGYAEFVWVDLEEEETFGALLAMMG